MAALDAALEARLLRDLRYQNAHGDARFVDVFAEYGDLLGRAQIMETRISQLERECRETRAENDSLLSRFERLRSSALPPEEVAALRSRAQAAEAAAAEATRERARASDEGMSALRQLAVLRQLHEAQERESREREEALQALGRRLKEALEEAAAAHRAVDLAAEESERRARALEASETALADARRDAGELAKRLVEMKADETRRLADADATRQELIADAKRAAAAILANAKMQSAQETLDARRGAGAAPGAYGGAGDASGGWGRDRGPAAALWDRAPAGPGTASPRASPSTAECASPSGRAIRDAYAVDSPAALRAPSAAARTPGAPPTSAAGGAERGGRDATSAGRGGSAERETAAAGAQPPGSAPLRAPSPAPTGPGSGPGSGPGPSHAQPHAASRAASRAAPPSPPEGSDSIGAAVSADADEARALSASLVSPGAPPARSSSAEGGPPAATSSGSSGSSGGLASTASSLTHSLAARIGPDPRQHAMAAAAAAAASLGSALGRAFAGRRGASADGGQGAADLGVAPSAAASPDHPLGGGRPPSSGARRIPSGSGTARPIELGAVSSSPSAAQTHGASYPSAGRRVGSPSAAAPPAASYPPRSELLPGAAVGAVSSSYRAPHRAPPARVPVPGARATAAPPTPVLSPQRLSGALLAHQGGAYCLAASPDGQVLASGGADATVALWAARTGLATAPDASHGGAPSYGAGAAAARARPPPAARPAARLRGAFESVTSLAFTLDSRFVLGAEARAAVRAWDVSTGRLRASLTGHVGRVLAVAASPVDAASAASAGADRTVKIWGLDRGYCVRTILCASSCRSIAYSRDGTALLSAHADGALRVWDLRAKHNSGAGGIAAYASVSSPPSSSSGSLEVAGLHAGPFGVVVGRSCGLILTGGRDGRLRLLDPRRFGALATLGARGFDPGGSWPSFDLAPDESRVAAGAADGSVFLWDVRGDPQALQSSSPLLSAAMPPPVDPTTPARPSGRLRVDGAGEPPGAPTAATVANRAILSLAWGALGAPLAVGTKGGVVAFFGDAGLDEDSTRA